jgi:hypothetical protein
MTASGSRQDLWWRWVTANALCEMIGLGATFAIASAMIARLEGVPGAAGVLIAAAVAIATGAVEATVVGLGQWWAMRPWYPGITRSAWWQATLIGALAAYVLGYLPSTLIDLGAASGAAPAPVEPPEWVVLLLAAGMGAAAGAVLSFAQWRVLRRHLSRAAWWIPANALAWAAGMPIIFWAMDVVFAASPLTAALLLGGALFVSGAVVGAIHGAFLVYLAPRATAQDRAGRRAAEQSAR